MPGAARALLRPRLLRHEVSCMLVRLISSRVCCFLTAVRIALQPLRRHLHAGARAAGTATYFWGCHGCCSARAVHTTPFSLLASPLLLIHPLPPLFPPRRTKKCTCNKPWSGAGCDVNRAYGRRSFFGCHLQPLPPAITEVCNTAINVQHRCPGYRLLAYSLCNHTCPLVENFGCGIGNVSHVCADPLIKCPDLVR